MGVLTISLTHIKCENEVINREPIYDDSDPPVEIGWYAKPTVNVTARNEDGDSEGYSVQFDNEGGVKVNGLTVEGASGLTETQINQLKTDAKFLYNKAKAVLNDLIDDEDMT